MTSRNWRAFQVGCAYVGTVVGAGFASGQEIYQFFGRYGNFGYISVVISMMLFAWLGYRMLALGNRLKAKSFHQVNRYLFGETVGTAVDIMMLIMLFGVTVAMIAGAGSLFDERMGLPFEVGVVVTIVVTYLTTLQGISGILRANSIIVPIMIVFVVFSALHAFHMAGWTQAWQTGGGLHHPNLFQSIVSAITYVSFNVGLAAGVLIPVGSDTGDDRVLRSGAIFGSAGLGIMMLAVLFTLFTHPEALTFDIPMGYVATLLGPLLQWAFILVLWGEIYSTLVGNVYAISAQLSGQSQRNTTLYTGVVLVGAFLLSQIGFTALVKYAYTGFGWVSLALIAALLWPRRQTP